MPLCDSESEAVVNTLPLPAGACYPKYIWLQHPTKSCKYVAAKKSRSRSRLRVISSHYSHDRYSHGRYNCALPVTFYSGNNNRLASRKGRLVGNDHPLAMSTRTRLQWNTLHGTIYCFLHPGRMSSTILYPSHNLRNLIFLHTIRVLTTCIPPCETQTK